MLADSSRGRDAVALENAIEAYIRFAPGLIAGRGAYSLSLIPLPGTPIAHPWRVPAR